ncbi:hypothetical protein M413DRAFT_449594 [Hebeloma cylindrosporum]|uniref:Uncharacterized protein n=1 Tax=Hebeloma cylindrosporum TaxID=76867 RepID=A0A0C3BUL3_HEBCY|nr:hypothetical protein M413DRAFT_449594 [Hebeloma cylindrosporum h7]
MTTLVHAAAVESRDGILPPINIPIDLIPEYLTLTGKCRDNDNTALAILYEGGQQVTYGFNECFPRKRDGHPAQMPVLCKAVACYAYPTDDCTGGAILPIGVPLLPGLTIINPFDIGQLLGGSALCRQL